MEVYTLITIIDNEVLNVQNFKIFQDLEDAARKQGQKYFNGVVTLDFDDNPYVCARSGNFHQLVAFKNKIL